MICVVFFEIGSGKEKTHWTGENYSKKQIKMVREAFVVFDGVWKSVIVLYDKVPIRAGSTYGIGLCLSTRREKSWVEE